MEKARNSNENAGVLFRFITRETELKNCHSSHFVFNQGPYLILILVG